MTYRGKVEEIVFVNEENGYTVLNFDADGEYFTAVGIFPLISEGEVLEITGEFKKNNKFGEQFQVESVKFSRPDDIEGVFKYLSSGLFRGVGEKLAAEIVKYFGMSTLDILENNPQELQRVNGIGKKKLSEIIDSYRDTKNMKEAVFFLQKYDITMGLAMKIYKRFEEATVSVIQNNPYILVEEIDGVGFLTADRIAERMGIDRRSEFRIRAGISHVLNEGAQRNGHTCLPQAILTEEGTKLLQVDRELVEQTLKTTPNIKFYETGGLTLVASSNNYFAENNVAAKLILLNLTCDKWDLEVDSEIGAYETTCGITLHENQKEAIRSVFKSGVAVITGGPGTGKTTIIKGITTILAQRNKKVILCAPTGRASKRMTEATGMESKTIHRLLGADISMSDKYDRGENNPITADVVVVDEISMADIFIFSALLKAIPRGTRLVMVGDKDQLPSVSCGNVLSDVIGSGFIAVTELSEIYRQAQESLIVVNAHRINKGQMPIIDNTSDFFISQKQDPSDVAETVVAMVKNRIPSFANVLSTEIQVLSPMKKGLVGVENLNLILQNALNPQTKEFRYKDVTFRLNDKVMQSVNDYDAAWQKADGGEVGRGVFNGDIGFVTAVKPNGIEVTFEDGKTISYIGEALGELMLAYCVSVHKSQGSEFPVVVLVLWGANPMLMTRNLLYTALTRAKNMAVIVGDLASVRRMVENNYTAKRYSLLKELMRDNNLKIEKLWVK